MIDPGSLEELRGLDLGGHLEEIGWLLGNVDHKEVLSVFRRRNKWPLSDLFNFHGLLTWVILIIYPWCHRVVAKIKVGGFIQATISAALRRS